MGLDVNEMILYENDTGWDEIKMRWNEKIWEEMKLMR